MQTGKCHCGGIVHLQCGSIEDDFREPSNKRSPETERQMEDLFRDVCLKVISGGESSLPILKN